MCHIYIYTHTNIHTHTDMRTHTLVQTSQFTLLLCMRAPECESLYSNRYRPPACTNTHTHFKNTHTSHALIFLAIVQQFYSSKPYHKSLHSCSISLYQYLAHKHRRQASAWTVLIVFPRSVLLLSSPQK